MTDIQRLFSIGNALLAADREITRFMIRCAEQGLDAKAIQKAVTDRRLVLCGPLRAQLDGDTLTMDDLAYLRALQEIASVLDDETGRWGDVAARCDDVISALDHALSAEVAAGRRAA